MTPPVSRASETPVFSRAALSMRNTVRAVRLNTSAAISARGILSSRIHPITRASAPEKWQHPSSMLTGRSDCALPSIASFSK